MVSIEVNRYSKALFEKAKEQDKLVDWETQIRRLGQLISEEAFSSFLKDKDVPWEKKAEASEKRLGQLDSEILNLVALLLDKDKLELLPEISDEFQKMVDRYRGISGVEKAEVITAVPLSDKDILELGEKLSQAFKKPVTIQTKINPEIIGGIIIKLGDKIIDGSLRTRLDTLREEVA